MKEVSFQGPAERKREAFEQRQNGLPTDPFQPGDLICIAAVTQFSTRFLLNTALKLDKMTHIQEA